MGLYQGANVLSHKSVQMFYLNVLTVIPGDPVLVWILLPNAPGLGEEQDAQKCLCKEELPPLGYLHKGPGKPSQMLQGNTGRCVVVWDFDVLWLLAWHC